MGKCETTNMELFKIFTQEPILMKMSRFPLTLEPLPLVQSLYFCRASKYSFQSENLSTFQYSLSLNLILSN